jgi:hypothetical protein
VSARRKPAASPRRPAPAAQVDTWSRRKTRPLHRDREETPFAAILASLVRRVPGARAAVLVDFEGETVDYAGQGQPYVLRVAAAHLRIVLQEAHRQSAPEAGAWLAVAMSGVSFRVQALPEGYAVLLVLSSSAGLPAACDRAFAVCARELAREAGWTESRRASWYPLAVETDERGRPVAANWGSKSVPLEVIGRFAAGLRGADQGWRVRSSLGIEATLIREPGSRWYSDELFVEGVVERKSKSV